MYKIKFDSHVGKGLYFVVDAKSATEAKRKFLSEMLSTDKIKGTPMKTTKKFVEGLKKINRSYYIVLD